MADALRLSLGLPFSSQGAGAGTLITTPMNASTVSIAWAFQAETANAITWGGFRRNASAGTPPTYRLSLQGADASGNPDGTIKASGNCFATFTGGSLVTGFNRINMGASYTPTRGEKLCWVLEYSSGTIDGSNNITVSTSSLSNAGRSGKFPAISTGASGVYTRVNAAPLFGYGTSTSTEVYGWPLGNAATQTINSGATAEAGMRFSLPSGWGSTYKVAGVRFSMGTTIVAKTITAKLYTGGGASDTTVLQDVDLDTDLYITTAGWQEWWFDETTLSALNFGDTYRVAISTPDASNQIINGMTVTSADDMNAFQLGANFYLTTRSGGNWTDTTTTRLFGELILADITKPSGGGGGSVLRSSIISGVR